VGEELRSYDQVKKGLSFLTIWSLYQTTMPWVCVCGLRRRLLVCVQYKCTTTTVV